MESEKPPLQTNLNCCEIIDISRNTIIEYHKMNNECRDLVRKEMDELRELRRIAEWKELFHENGVSHPDYKLRIEKDSTGYRLIIDRGKDNVIEFKRKAGNL